MLKNYIKVAVRNILKHKSYSLINILGLAGSLAITILILFFAKSVLTYDQFHTDADQIYFMYRDRATEDGRIDIFDTWYPLVEAAQTEFPAIESATRTIGIGSTTIEGNEKTFEQSITYADSSFFNVFSFKLLKGNLKTALFDPNAVIISSEVADKFFGDEDPIGKTLRFGFSTDRMVTGVLDEIPTNSSFTFDCIAPLTKPMVTQWIGDNHWRASFVNSYVKIRDDANIETLKPQLNKLMDKYVSKQEQGNFLLLPLKNYYDKMTGQDKYAYIMLLVAFGILIIAIINFTNLATAQSLMRVKEVGVRKVLGANRSRLIKQFLAESLLLTFTALIIGGFLAELALPVFSELIDMEIDIVYSFENLSMILALGLFVGFIAGGYPALFTSKLEASQILKNQKASGRLTIRNILVSTQFVLAIALISSVGIIMQQIDFLKSHDLNFDQNNVMVIPLSVRDFQDMETAMPRVISFKNELEKLSGVEGVTGSSSVPSNYRRSFTLFLPKGKEDMPPLDWQVAIIDHDYFETYGVKILEGRSFNRGSQNDFERGAILNQAALDQIGWESIEGKQLLFPESRQEIDIIGLVENFNVQSLKEPVQPLVHYYGGDSAQSYRFISLKLKPESRQNTLAAIAATWDKMDFGLTYEYYFPSDQFEELYATEESVANVLSYAMIFAVIIASLGLYALASFSIMLKTKEIAIRKVLGASINGIVYSFSKKYLLLVLLAGIPAVLLSWFSMSKWLEDFAYRITIGPSVYLIAITGAMLIAFFTVAYHAIKAGFTNPIESLKEE